VTHPSTPAAALETTFERTVKVIDASATLPRRQKRVVRGVARVDAQRQVLIAALQTMDIQSKPSGSALDAALRLALTSDDPRRRVLSRTELDALNGATAKYRWDPWAVDAILGIAMQKAAKGTHLVTPEDWQELFDAADE
jgi:hypothetical protein